MKKYEVVIIGGGLGGLACAATLAKKGKTVLLLEKNPALGGYQATYKKKGFTIEPCLHVMLEVGRDGSIYQILSELGVENEIEFSRFDPTSQFIFPDLNIKIPPDRRDFLALLKNQFPHEAGGIDEFFNFMKGIYEGLQGPPEQNPAIMEYSNKVFQSLLDTFIKDKKLQAIVAGYCSYFGGLPPSQISSLLMCAFTDSIISKGGYLPKEGVEKLIDLFEKTILKFGGEVSKKSPVKTIIIKDGKAAGVTLENGEEIHCDNVVSGADATTTFLSMVGEMNLPRDFIDRLRQIPISHSSFNVFLGVKGENLALEKLAQAVCFHPDYDLDKQYQAMLQGAIEETNFWISIPTISNPFMAPEGHHIVVVYVPIPYKIKGIDWKDKGQEFTQRVINLAERVIPGLKQNIVMTDAATPETLVRYTGNTGGGVGGWASTPEADSLMPSNKTPIEGLFLAGHWTFPGPGTGRAIQSGWLTASMID